MGLACSKYQIQMDLYKNIGVLTVKQILSDRSHYQNENLYGDRNRFQGIYYILYE